MYWNREGATRAVLLTRRYAIKLPNWQSLQNLVWGLRANRLERRWSGSSSDLCPVILALPLGLLLVQPRCTPLVREEWFAQYDVLLQQFATRRHLVEHKMNSFGWHGGVIVAVDYGGLPS